MLQLLGTQDSFSNLKRRISKKKKKVVLGNKHVQSGAS